MKPFIDSGELVMVGLIQEQHADRCLLFQQWKELDFPVVQDALNSIGITEVPVYVAIDEHGIVRSRPRRPTTFAVDFIEQQFSADTPAPAAIDLRTASPDYWRAQRQQTDSVVSQIGLADSLMIWKPDVASVRQAIDLYTRATQHQSARSDLRFRLGVANRLLYELEERTDADYFATAVSSWEAALQLNPNHYIYRRRIEQYGPRLKKPYSFYDWVTNARQEISDRGETPRSLRVEPNGAELAQRAKNMAVDTTAKNPDPGNRILRDREFVQVHVNFVPSAPRPGDVVAVHVGFHVAGTAKWNHETSPLQLWIGPPPGELQLSTQLISDETPYSAAESRDPLSLSFELQIPEKQTGDIRLDAFALYNICETEGGQCLYRRRDFSIELPVSSP